MNTYEDLYYQIDATIEKEKFKYKCIKIILGIIGLILCISALHNNEHTPIKFLIGLTLILFAIKYKFKSLNDFLKEKEHLKEILEKEEIESLPYKKTYLLTKNELYFYKNLKPVADELGYTILSKIRVADLVKVNSNDKWEEQKYFNKISRKHVDFALAKPDNLEVILLIELDDNSHDYEQRERDIFINKLYNKTGYKLLRVRGSGNLKEKIEEMIKPKVEEDEIIAK